METPFFKFLFIGGTTFLIYYFFLFTFFSILNMPYVYAIVIAYTLAISFHFFANRNHVFNARDGSIISQTLKYALLALANYLIQVGIVYVFFTRYGVNFYLATILALVVTMIFGYLLMGKWIFRVRL
jgi:putative flippase GtrA